MEGWISLVGWPIVDSLPIKWSPGKVCRLETDVLTLSYAANQVLVNWTFWEVFLLLICYYSVYCAFWQRVLWHATQTVQLWHPTTECDSGWWVASCRISVDLTALKYGTSLTLFECHVFTGSHCICFESDYFYHAITWCIHFSSIQFSDFISGYRTLKKFCQNLGGCRRTKETRPPFASLNKFFRCLQHIPGKQLI